MAASKNLSKREIEILSILAHAENPMTLSDLGLVEVDSIVFRKKSFARAFRIADNSKNVLSGMFLEEYQSFRQLFADSYLLAPLVESELKNPLSSQAEIERLEEILETAKKKLR